ncbi:PH domain-containing protein [Aurantiacibacter gilvus]|uniref:PH domain-containing protein n=1 Tax=Aurantiacibacter gilvus TaxID=3139141 RepID=A0ABU9ICX4_9SPHN
MDNERDVFRPSLGRWLWGTLAGLGTLALGVAGIAILVGAAGNWGPWPLLLTLLAVLIVLAKWLQVASVRYELDANRLKVRRGIIMKSIDEIELYRVKDVRMNFSLLNQIAGIGSITITSSDETTRNGHLVMPYVPHAEHRREEIRRLVDAARERRGVRELDMAHDHFGGASTGD